MSDNSHLTYHPDSPYFGKEGYIHSLTEQQSDDLAELQRWIAEEGIDMTDLCLNYLSPQLVLLRYLRANKFSIAKVKDHILRNIEWRAEMNVKELVNMHPSKILGCDISGIMTLFPHFQRGFDKFGRPILYKHYSSTFDATRIKSMSSMDALAKYHVWEQEACMRLCYEQSLKTGYIVETVTGIVDVAGLQLSQLSRDLLAVIKLVAEIDQSQYPETMGQTFVLNTSPVFPVVWNMVKPWLDPVVAGKIHLTGRPEQWMPLLDEYIDMRHLSSTYGGMQAALDVTAPPYAAITGEGGDEPCGEDGQEAVLGRLGTIRRRMMEGTPRPTIAPTSTPTDLLTTQVDGENMSIVSVATSSSSSAEDESLRYHPDSPYATRPGFLGSLSQEQQSALEAVQKWAIDARVDMTDLNMHALHPKLTLLRYLRANKWSVAKAIEQMQRNLKWRVEMCVKELCEMQPDEILGCKMSDLVEFFPHWQSGFDKFGRPVLYKQYNNSFDAAKILRLCTAEDLARYHVWEQEACMRLCHEQSRKTGYIVETLTAVIDVKGMQLYQVTRDFLAIMKTIADIDQNQYPETLGQTFIINTPSVFPLVWRGVRPWLDPVVTSKIQIFGAKEDEWVAALDAYIGLANMPSTYGGDLARLDENFHPYQSILGPAAGGMDHRGHSITDRMHAEMGCGGERGRRTLSRMFSNRSVMSESTIGSSAFGDALEGQSTCDYDGWGTELTFIRSMVRDLDSVALDMRGEGSSYLEAESVAPSRVSSSSSSSSDPRLQRCLPASLYSCFKIVSRRVSMGFTALVPNVLLRQSKNDLRKWLTAAVCFYILLSLVCIGLTGYALSNMYWTSTALVRVQMWSGVVIMCLSSLLALLNFAGFVGSATSNRPLLVLYSTFLSFYFVIFLVIGIICSVFATGNSRITGLSNQALGRVSDGENVGTVLRHYNMILGAVSAVLSLSSLIPLVLSNALCEVLKRKYKRDSNATRRHTVDRLTRERMRQFRVVVRFAQVVSIMIALAMIGYGASALNFLLEIRLDYFVFSVYCLLYSGVTVLIRSAMGTWASYTSKPLVVRYYLTFAIPLATGVVLTTAILNCVLLPQVQRQVSKSYEDLTINEAVYSQEKLETIVQIHLLVSGVLAISAVLFQAMCISSVFGLHRSLKRWKSHCAQRSAMLRHKQSLAMTGGSLAELNKLDQWMYSDDFVPDAALYDEEGLFLTFSDKLILAWSILMGLFHIYLNGTYAMFAYRVVDGGSGAWFISLWRQMGKYDSRYTSADDFLVSSNGIMATVVGPLLLVSV